MTTPSKQKLNRGAGVLLPISAVPSSYGIGTLGAESYQFVDFLERIGCKYWQVLPVGPTSYGDSPYQSFSAFAGNPYFIDLDVLAEEGLLDQEELKELPWMKEEDTIDYEAIFKLRFPILRKAFMKSNYRVTQAYIEFCEKNEYWLEDYSLYMAVKGNFHDQEWQKWDEEIRYRKKEAVDKYSKLLENEIEFWKFTQFKFKEQWDCLKDYTNKKGIQIIGDIPLYVAADSSDVWVHGDLFELDERKNPINVAGVPPDLFSELGQRWGNPIYRWEVMEKNNFTWWKERMKMSAALYDIIRIDHFIGVVNYYSIPSTCPTAVEGKWEQGPGKKLTDVIKESIGDAKIIAEDLGILTQNVKDLIEETGYPGMKVLEFGMEGPADNDYLPHNYKSSNLVAYTGTHDNETLFGYVENKKDEDLEFTYRYFNTSDKKELVYAVIRSLYSSIADVAVVQMQDLLMLGNAARMNFPSTIGGNWQWRLKKSQYNELNEELLLDYARIFNRAPELQKVDSKEEEAI